MEDFEEFYRAEMAGLVALARGLASPAVAEDIAQEAMLVAMRRWPQVRDMEHPQAFVRRVCANLAVSSFRRRLAELRALNRAAAQPVPALTDDLHEEFWRLVRALPRRQAQSVALHYLFDLTVGQVAETLGCSEGSVKVHLSRGRETLARRIESRTEVPL